MELVDQLLDKKKVKAEHFAELKLLIGNHIKAENAIVLTKQLIITFLLDHEFHLDDDDVKTFVREVYADCLTPYLEGMDNVKLHSMQIKQTTAKMREARTKLMRRTNSFYFQLCKQFCEMVEKDSALSAKYPEARELLKTCGSAENNE